MNFKKKRQKYENKLAVESWNSPPKSGYNSQHISKLLERPESFAKFVGLKKFQAGDLKNVNKIFTALKDDDDVIRYMAVSNLSLIENEQVNNYLKQSLQDRSYHVRFAALEVVREKCDTDFYEDVKLLESDNSKKIRKEAGNVLQQLDKLIMKESRTKIANIIKNLEDIDGISVTISAKKKTIYVEYNTHQSLNFKFTWSNDHYIGYFLDDDGKQSQAVISIWDPLEAIHFATSYSLLTELRAGRK